MKEDVSKKPQLGCPTLTLLETQVLSQIFRTILATGGPPTIGELESELKKSSRDILELLDVLELKDRLVREKETGKIVSIYPLSVLPTDHRVFTRDGRELFAMCALDALAIPTLFQKDGKAVSQCEWCKEKIIIEIVDGQIVSQSQPEILIWNPEQVERPAAKKCCPLVNFFCSEKHLRDWEAKNPDLVSTGRAIPLEQAYSDVKACWSRYAAMMWTR